MQTGIFKNGECILSFDEYDDEPLYNKLARRHPILIG